MRLLTAFFALATPTFATDPCPRLSPGLALDNFFHPCRPEPVTEAEKDRILRSLPSAGEASSLSRAEQKKLAAVTAVLELHRRTGVYTIKVVNVAPATTALHGRAVLIISRPALALLTAEELQALVAHEIGHEYVWTGFAEARRKQDSERLRELELICDTIAAETLRLLDVPAERLITALEAIAHFNRERMGATLNVDSYPDIKARKRAITAWKASAPKP